MIDTLQFGIEPHVEVNHGDSFQLVELPKVGYVRPALGDHAFHHIHRHGTHVLVRNHFIPGAHEQVFDGTVVVRDNLLDRRGCLDTPTPCFHIILHRRTNTIRLIPIQKRHLQPITLVQKPIHRGQYHRHAQFIRIDKIQRLGHGNKNLLINPLGHAILPHKFRNAQFILLVNETLPLNQHGDQRRSRLDFLGQREHLLIH
mmetsp:Transcript_3960/g.4091  ORF Transcript_3960/g.4091 Transcript_3960/m.4091 type:complete len:201 (+) Transcript_3960:375-977(+)